MHCPQHQLPITNNLLTQKYGLLHGHASLLGAGSLLSRLLQVLLSFPDAVPLGVECFRDGHSPQLKLNPPDDYVIQKGALSMHELGCAGQACHGSLQAVGQSKAPFVAVLLLLRSAMQAV